MVCKRSLYCWKNGPCASEQTRKQIWEDNIRFRESLRDINQSDHYWSFQIYKNKCMCLEGEELRCERPLSRKYRSASLQRLHDIDCTSITHDCNGLKFRNCFVHCPFHGFNRNSGRTKPDTPVPQSLIRKETILTSEKYPLNSLHKPERDKHEYCHRYKNTLMNACIKPNMKTKFLSQSNLSSFNENKRLPDKKVLYSSFENISKIKAQKNKLINSASKTEKTFNAIQSKEDILSETTKAKEGKDLESANKTDCEVQTDLVKSKKIKQLKPLRKYPYQEIIHEFSPISRTTKKMLAEKKKIPFATYGCNNNNLDIGSKRTHNVLASKLEVYPNALSAKQQKRDFLMKYIQSEKEFQRKCLPEELQRKINHSCLWSTDKIKKESKPFQNKNSKYLLPVMNKPLKKMSVSSSQIDPGNARTYCKPQIYFY